MRSKNAVLGGIMSTLIATLIVIAILLIFALYSGIVKTFGNIDSGIKIVKENEVGFSTVQDYNLYAGNVFAFRKIVNSKINDILFIQVMSSWDKSNTAKVAGYIERFTSANQLYIENSKISESIFCQANSCFKSGEKFREGAKISEIQILPYIKMKIATQ